MDARKNSWSLLVLLKVKYFSLDKNFAEIFFANHRHRRNFSPGENFCVYGKSNILTMNHRSNENNLIRALTNLQAVFL